VKNINFLGIYINNTLSWKTHIDKILLTLSSACFAIRTVKPFMSPQMLKAIYYAYFYYIITYGIIFCSHSTPSAGDYRFQKKHVRIMTGSRAKDLCRKESTKLEIRPLPSVYIFSVLRFVIKIRNC
jgi:hypothetical protein